MTHIHLTPQEAVHYTLAAIGARFMPLGDMIDATLRVLAAADDDPVVDAYQEARRAEWMAAEDERYDKAVEDAMLPLGGIEQFQDEDR